MALNLDIDTLVKSTSAGRAAAIIRAITESIASVTKEREGKRASAADLIFKLQTQGLLEPPQTTQTPMIGPLLEGRERPEVVSTLPPPGLTTVEETLGQFGLPRAGIGEERLKSGIRRKEDVDKIEIDDPILKIIEIIRPDVNKEALKKELGGKRVEPAFLTEMIRQLRLSAPKPAKEPKEDKTQKAFQELIKNIGGGAAVQPGPTGSLLYRSPTTGQVYQARGQAEYDEAIRQGAKPATAQGR